MSVKQTKRQNIPHLQNMHPIVFLRWMRSLKTQGYCISNVKTVMKVDGLGARFGKDSQGQVFIEGSNTMPIFDSGEFVKFTLSKTTNPKSIERAMHYEDMFNLIRTSDFINNIPNNTKIVCEIFYNPMAEVCEDGIIFVNVKYDKSKLGSVMTILPYTVLNAETGLEYHNQFSVLKELYNESSNIIKFINPNLKCNTIDMKPFVDRVLSLPDDVELVITSRKKEHLLLKLQLMNTIQIIKNELCDYLLDHCAIEGKYKLGPEIEGIVMHLPDDTDIFPYKITTPKFKQTIKKKL
jgi:hypothetical protein